MQIYVYIYIWTSLHINAYIHIHTHMYVCIYVCIHIYMYLFIFVKGLGLLPVIASLLFLNSCQNAEVVFAVSMICCVPGNVLCNIPTTTLWHVMLWAFPSFLRRVKETDSILWYAQIHVGLLTSWFFFFFIF